MKPLVHLVDDDEAIRDAISGLLASIDIDVAAYARAHAFLEAPDTLQPGCIILDLRMPDMSGLELQRLLGRRGQLRPILFLTGHGDVDITVRAMRQGAAEVLTKPVKDELMLEKVRAAVDLDRRQRAWYNQQASIRARLELLTPRERQVLGSVVDGQSNKGIARELGISPKTVELHRGNMMLKMHAGSLAELIRMWLQVEPEANRPQDGAASESANGSLI